LKTNGHWLISAGDLSGDILGADLICSLKEITPHLQFSGITGPALSAEGVRSIASFDELNVMGIMEVVKKLASICMLKRKILEYVDRHNIKVAILIDSAGFHLKLAEELKIRGVYVIQYVAPKLWAWGENRIANLKQNVDLLLATFPFEETFFQERGLECHYIGCPIAKRTENMRATKKDLGFHSEQILFAFLPGSRAQEVSRLLGPMLSIAKKIKAILPQAEFIIPIASSLRDSRNRKLFSIYKEDSVHFLVWDSLEVMAASDVALVASGTATLECALINTPLAVIYSMNPLTHWLARKKIRVQWASLVNILRSKLVVQEFIQDFDHLELAEELISLVIEGQKRESMLAEFSILRDDLTRPTASNAATHILNALQMTPYVST
jgi:lipid-A-disaccharide synthase